MAIWRAEARKSASRRLARKRIGRITIHARQAGYDWVALVTLQHNAKSRTQKYFSKKLI